MIDYEKHNQEIFESPMVKAGHTPIIIPPDLAERMVELGMWDPYKRFVAISMPIKVTYEDTP